MFLYTHSRALVIVKRDKRGANGEIGEQQCQKRDSSQQQGQRYDDAYVLTRGTRSEGRVCGFLGWVRAVGILDRRGQWDLSGRWLEWPGQAGQLVDLVS